MRHKLVTKGAVEIAKQLIENFEKIYRDNRLDALAETRAEMLEEIFPVSPITPEDHFCQMKEVFLTKEGFIQPKKELLQCIEQKRAPNGMRILTQKDIFKSDTLQRIQKAIKK